MLNYMLYVRGNRHDYDNWAAQGNDGWAWHQVFPYFLKSEDNRNPYLAATDYHTAGGYLTVSLSLTNDSTRSHQITRLLHSISCLSF